jgi:hypothetical protein
MPRKTPTERFHPARRINAGTSALRPIRDWSPDPGTQPDTAPYEALYLPFANTSTDVRLGPADRQGSGLEYRDARGGNLRWWRGHTRDKIAYWPVTAAANVVTAAASAASARACRLVTT